MEEHIIFLMFKLFCSLGNASHMHIHVVEPFSVGSNIILMHLLNQQKSTCYFCTNKARIIISVFASTIDEGRYLGCYC